MKAKVKYTFSSLENMLPNINSMKRLDAATIFNNASVEFLRSELVKIFIVMRIRTAPKKMMLMRFPVFIKSRLSSSNPWLLYLIYEISKNEVISRKSSENSNNKRLIARYLN